MVVGGRLISSLDAAPMATQRRSTHNHLAWSADSGHASGLPATTPTSRMSSSLEAPRYAGATAGRHRRARQQRFASGAIVPQRGMATASPRPAGQTDEAAKDKAEGEKKASKAASGGKSKEGAVATKPKFNVKKVDGGDSQIGYFVNTAKRTLLSIPGMTMDLAKAIVNFVVTFASNPRGELSHIWDHIKADANHYWVGSKLLWTDVKIASKMVSRMIGGSTLTRRERKQLIRTTTDIMRIVPFSFFLIVPFMELLLPVAIRLFPSMLPSTFEKQYEVEAQLKRDLKMRVNMAGFMKDMLREMAKDVKTQSDDEGASAKQLTTFVEKARHGTVKNEDIVKFAKMFHDDLTLDNMGRAQLVTMCSFMNLRPYGADAFLRFQLRSKIRDILEDDRRIVWEGVEALSRSELQEACMERGMRGLGVPKADLARQLQQWLDLSCNRHVPISLLIMSRSFALTENPEDVEKAIADSISSLDEEIVNEAVLEAATPEERKTDEIRELKIETLKYQSELIDDEREDAEEDKKKAEEKKAAKKAAKEAAALEAAAIEAAVEEAKDAYSTMQNAHIAPVEEAKGVFDAMASVERGESVEGEATASDGTSFTTAAKGKTTNTVEAETTDGAPSATSMEAAAAEMKGEVEAAGEALEEGEKEKEKEKDEVEKEKEEDEDEDSKGITLEEIETLADYASSSAVDEERDDIAAIKSKVDEIVSVFEDDEEEEDDEAAVAREQEMAALYAAMSPEEREAAMAEMSTEQRRLMVDVDSRVCPN